MGQKITYTCDRCGAAIDSRKGFKEIFQRKPARLGVDPYSFNKQRDFLLCADCSKEFESWLESPSYSGYVEMPTPANKEDVYGD